MQEQRDRPRSQLMFHLEIKDARTHEPVGQLVDITSTGLGVMADESLRPGQSRRLEMDIPFEVPGSDRFEFDAVVKWSRPGSDPGVYNAGLGELDLDPVQRQRLEEVIVTYDASSLL